MMAAADGASAHSEAAGLDAGLAEDYGVCGAELARERWKSERAPREIGRMDPGGTSGASGAMDKFATFHAASLLRNSRECLPLMDA
jgi:hypothetical protein